jgi:phage terminase Nu1 subunit (DNA packaging protein)
MLRWGRCLFAAVQHNARTLSGPPSTGVTITMDGDVADTARANTAVLTSYLRRHQVKSTEGLSLSV